MLNTPMHRSECGRGQPRDDARSAKKASTGRGTDHTTHVPPVGCAAPTERVRIQGHTLRHLLAEKSRYLVTRLAAQPWPGRMVTEAPRQVKLLLRWDKIPGIYITVVTFSYCEFVFAQEYRVRRFNAGTAVCIVLPVSEPCGK